MTNQVSDLKISTACTTYLKNKPDTRGAAPYLPRMHDILLQTVLDRYKLFTTSGQSFHTAKITCTRYFKEVIISRGRP